ncbi:MAG: DUF1292 domain-containing protein [Butyrivibrio sp.]|nr:DUF1292 domain-containing protein [Butyrivibrio sp.]
MSKVEFSEIAREMNTRIENDEQITVDLDLDDGKSVTCAVIIVLTVDSKDYIVLLPLDEKGQNNDGMVWFYRFHMENMDSEPELGYIDDDDEYENVAEAFDLYLDDVEFDEIVDIDPADLPPSED